MRVIIADATHFNTYAGLFDDMENPRKMLKVSEEYLQSLMLHGDESAVIKRIYGNRAVLLMNVGSRIINHVLAEKVIPAADAKRFEKAAKALTGASRAPNKPYAWWIKNKDALSVLIDADRWKDKNEIEDTGLIQKVKGFDVLNQAPKLKEKDYDTIVEDFKKAMTLIERSGVSHSKSLFYGNCILTPEISRKNVLAYYALKEDAIYLKPSTKDRADMVQTIIHEIGHRLWNKFLSAEDKDSWKAWHRACEYTRVDIKMPSVGDTLPVKVNKIPDYPIVTKIIGDQFYLNDSDNAYLTFKQIYPYYQTKAKFPSLYSTTSAEEHFCEAFAFYCLGDLKDKHLLNFESNFKR